jgi:hypothetical protein
MRYMAIGDSMAELLLEDRTVWKYAFLMNQIE